MPRSGDRLSADTYQTPSLNVSDEGQSPSPQQGDGGFTANSELLDNEGEADPRQEPGLMRLLVRMGLSQR
jgi:hypothetical protein